MKSASESLRKINRVNVWGKEVIPTLRAIALFTSISKQLAVDAIKDALKQSNHEDRNGLTTANIM